MLKHQGASIRTLNFGQHTGKWRKTDLAKLTIEGLTTLGIEAGTGLNSPWATELLARTYQTLRHLRLGNDKYLATEYAKEGVFDIDDVHNSQQTHNLAEIMKVKVAASNESTTPALRLESLSLTGLDLNAFVSCFQQPIIVFENLSILTLESCCCLNLALPLLMGTGAGRRKAKSALRLHTLTIRHENTSNEHIRSLETFLTSLRPLAHLHILLEGYSEEGLQLEKVLQVHGTCLQSLIWDERTGPRTDVQDDTAFNQYYQKNLQLIAKHCSGLKALGIAFDWEDVFHFEKNHKKVKQ